MQPVFQENMLILNELLKYAPTDDRLLLVPRYSDSFNPLFDLIFKVERNDKKNNFLVGANLLSFFRSTNRVLSRVYAAHEYIIANWESNLNQSGDHLNLLMGDLIINEYRETLRNFVLMLRVSVDQIILLLKSIYYEKSMIDSISGFLNLLEQDNNTAYDKKFLTALNASSNFLKHHPYQLEAPNMEIPSLSPALSIILDEKTLGRINKDYERVKLYFTENEWKKIENNNIYFQVPCDFLVQGFNSFFQKIKET